MENQVEEKMEMGWKLEFQLVPPLFSVMLLSADELNRFQDLVYLRR